jgi:multicomponent K+:H+ antiporter subunit E
MRRLIPSPWLSAVLFVAWPLLNQSWSLAQVTLGAVLALLIPSLTQALRPDRPVLRHPTTIARLALVVLWDIVVSNIEVARRILGPEARIQPRFVWLPLTITDPHGIVTLASIITMTPGTLSSELTEDRRHLLIHAFNVRDETALIADIKARYETPLIDIFEGGDA